MTEAEAPARATAAMQREGLQGEMTGLKSIRLSLASEVREGLRCDETDVRDTWYVSFSLKLDEDVVDQSPDNVLFTVDDQSGEVTLVYQM
jgi:hypothetical protein